MKLKINGLSWKVEFYSQDKMSSDTIDLCGLTQKTQLIIYLNQDLDKELLYRTIVHELVHAYVWSYGFENGGTFTEENLANFFEAYFRLILKDADSIFSYFEKIRLKEKEKYNIKPGWNVSKEMIENWENASESDSDN